MYKDTQPPGVGMSVVCDGVSWPAEFEIRREIGQQIEDELCSVLASLNIPAAQITVFNRYIYAQVDLGCPVCQSELDVGTVERPPGEFAYLPVECRRCGWTSRAVYALIDYHDDISLTDFAGGVTSEAVEKYDTVTPSYCAYPRLTNQSDLR